MKRSSSNDSYASTSALNVSRDYARNGLNQYTATTSNGAPSATFAYDLNGNLQSDGSTGFVYDAENRLVSASGAKTATLAYDPLGRLWQVSGGSAGTTRFVYDGDRLLEEYDGATGIRQRAYAHGPGTDEPMIWYQLTGGGPQRRLLHADHQGSIVAVADDYGGALAINAYDAWGIPNAANLGRFQYTGQAWIGELGMYYYKARFYSPTLGRFMQTDPVGYKDEVNLYAYVGNDPVNKTDPQGTYTCKVQCDRVAQAVGRLRQAARVANNMTGTRIKPGFGRGFSGLVGFLGRANVDNGVSLNGEALPDGVYGHTSGQGKNISIGLDFAQIDAEKKGYLTAAGTLAHETSHGIQRRSEGSPTSLGDVFHREWVANSVESATNELLAEKSVLWGPGMPGEERRRRIRGAANASCEWVRNANLLRWGSQTCPQ